MACFSSCSRFNKRLSVGHMETVVEISPSLGVTLLTLACTFSLGAEAQVAKEKHWIHPNRIQWHTMWEATSVWSASTYHSHRPLPTPLDPCLLSSTPSITNSLDFWNSRTQNSGPCSWRSLARNSCGGLAYFFALCDEFHLAKKGIKLLKSIPF